MKKTTFHLTDQSYLPELIQLLSTAVATGEQVVTIERRTRRRTVPQNSALHLYCELMAELMRNAGIDQRELVGRFKEGFTLPVQAHMIKDIFRAVGLALFKKESTADLTTTELQEVYKIVDQRFGEVTGVNCGWPSNEPPVYEGVE